MAYIFERKITTIGNAEGITIPKYLRDNEGFIKGKGVRVTLELIEETENNINEKALNSKVISVEAAEFPAILNGIELGCISQVHGRDFGSEWFSKGMILRELELSE